MTTIETLAMKYSQAIPGYTLVKYIEVASPVHKFDLGITLLKQKELTALQEFILKFVKENVLTVESISRFLGLNENVIIDAISDLIVKELLSRDIYKKEIKLTEKGNDALSKAAMIFPEDTELNILYMDAITKNIYGDRNMPYDSSSNVKKLGISSLMENYAAPLVSDIPIESLKIILNKKTSGKKNDALEGELLSINEVLTTYVEYKRLNVLMYINTNTQDMELRVFEKSTRIPEYETAILKQYNENLALIGFDYKSAIDETPEKPLLGCVPKPIILEAKESSKKLAEYDNQINSIHTQIVEYEDSLSDGNVSKEEKESATQIIRQLQSQIDNLQKEKSKSNKIIHTYEHRPLLLKALEESAKSIVIVSPWIKQAATNQEIITLIDKALQRNVSVYIGYGFNEEQQSDKWIVKKLEDIKKKPYGVKLQIVNLSNTHEKVLISDENFMVITSFNWLSFKGDPNRGFRQETGFYTEAREIISDMKTSLSERMEIEII